MVRSFRHLAAAILALGFFTLPSLAEPSAEELAEPAVDPRLDSLMVTELAKAHAPAGGLAILRGGRIVYEKAYGLSDPATGQMAGPETLFSVASLSKPVTATVLMRLWDKGLFGLDDAVDAYLPFALRLPGHPKEAITFRMLLSHTSGIVDGPAYEASYSYRLPEKPQDSPEGLEDFLESYLLPTGARYSALLNFRAGKPGGVKRYSNVGYGLLGYLAERIGGKPFPELCREEVFLPLGMATSAWRYRDLPADRVALPYGWDDLGGKPVRIGYYGFPTYPDGALKTSPHEYALFLGVYARRGLLPDGAVYLSRAAMDELLGGLCWEKGASLWGHDGADPGVFTRCAFDPARGDAYLYFTTGDPTTPSGLLRMRSFAKAMTPAIKAWRPGQ